MALSATIHTFEVQLADLDRGVYDDLSLRVARHPSETAEFMMTRVLAYCLEYQDGIAFGAGGISSTEEPAVLARDLTGDILLWIEIGAPDAQRLHYGSKLAERAAVYTHRDPAKVCGAWAGKQIHRAADIVVRSFDPGFIDALTAKLERRNDMTVSLTEGQLYIDLNGEAFTSALHERTVA